MHDHDQKWMRVALENAQMAFDNDEIPVGAVLVRDDKRLGVGFNSSIHSLDPSGHAEIIALRNACKQEGNYRLPGATLFVTIEPCTMCLGAIVHARVARIVYGAREPKAGVLDSNPVWNGVLGFNHEFSWQGGVCESESRALIRTFFQTRRELKRQLKQRVDDY